MKKTWDSDLEGRKWKRNRGGLLPAGMGLYIEFFQAIMMKYAVVVEAVVRRGGGVMDGIAKVYTSASRRYVSFGRGRVALIVDMVDTSLHVDPAHSQ